MGGFSGRIDYYGHEGVVRARERRPPSEAARLRETACIASR